MTDASDPPESDWWDWWPAALGFVFVLGCGGAWCSPQNPLRVCQETFRYGGLLESRRTRYPGWTDHFPDAIPEGVADVRVCAQPGLFQGLPFLHLSYRTSPADAERTIAPLRRRAVARYSALRWWRPDGTAEWPDETTTPFVMDDAPQSAPTIEALVLGPELERRSGPNWDLERSYGIGVDHATGRVWFWAER